MNGRRVATLTDVAKAAGVSLTTASKAMNGQARVSDETRARVLKVAQKLAYSPNPMARSLISGRSGTVGMIMIDSLSQRFVVPAMLGAEAALSEVDLSMITADARGDVTRLHSLADMLHKHKVDGLLVVGDNNSPTPPLHEDYPLPVVYLYGEPGRPREVTHVPDDHGGAVLVARHLVGLGRRRIVHVTGPKGSRAVSQRVLGLRDELRRSGIKPAAPTVYGRWSQRWGAEAGARLLGQLPDIDAFLCGSDQIAAGVVDAVLRSGRRIPEDVAVTGFDNWSPFALETEPPLTTIDLNLEELGASAVRDLFSVIDGVRVGGGVRLHDCSLVVRGSTDPAA
jgi:LacI family transcriptional regulator